ncbi:hypothetical protein [Sporosarcina sp. FA9]|uniref:hypothetical protein n=1 Tax=Sporosarcina sp. FA9 TaxID=3413030 RepID=UPI003F65B70A
MKKKMLTLVVMMFSMMLTFLFVSSPASASVKIDGDPTSVLTAADDKSWFSGVESSELVQYHYFERTRNNQLYRGYLTFSGFAVGRLYTYEGYLYRYPLSYPVPLIQPEQLAD